MTVEATPAGPITVPVHAGHPMTPEELQQIPDKERPDLERRSIEVQAEVAKTFRHLSQLEREGAELLIKLDREIARFAIEPLLHGLREKYTQQPDVVSHLEQIAEDIPNHLPDFRQAGPEGGAEPTSPWKLPSQQTIPTATGST